MINKKGILDFLDKLSSNEDYKSSFLSNISNDEDTFLSFEKAYSCTHNCLSRDLDFFLDSDPAANSKEEIEIAYPGYKAIKYYRIAHILYNLGLKIEARVVSEESHFLTGIDIHPGAEIGCPFFIDHGTGIVIGETSIIGNNCKIYQGVTLGALSLSKGSALKGIKRHPTIGNNVIIYAGASILGGEVVVGDDVVIGSNVFLLESIPSNHKVTIDKPKLLINKRK